MLHNRLTKRMAVKKVREKSFLLKASYKNKEKMLTIHKKIHELSGIDESSETVRRILNFTTNPMKSATAPAVFKAFNAQLREHGIREIEYSTIQHHFPIR